MGYGSTEFIVVRALDEVSIEWVYYCLQKLDFINDGKTVMTGSVGHQRITPEFVKNYSIPLPSITIQNQIVSKLDIERRMIASQQKLIDLFHNKMDTKLSSLWHNE